MPADLATAYEDRDLWIVVKPTGLATTAPAHGDSLTRRLEGASGLTLHPTSRLDAEVTGLVTFAKSARAIEALRRARSAGRYGRGYLAIAGGVLPSETGAWEASIAIDPRDVKLRIAVTDRERARKRMQQAKTEYRVREVASGASVLWLTPHTGRTHQLRVHAAHAGVPLLGDARYGGAKRVVLPDGRVVAARRTMLHCAWLRLPRIEGDGDLELSSAVPEDMRGLWEKLGGGAEALRPVP